MSSNLTPSAKDIVINFSKCYNIRMADSPLISWSAPEHIHTEKQPDWYWIVGVITLAIAAVCFIFGNIVPGIFVIVAAAGLVIHVSGPIKEIKYSINDRGLFIDDALYPFLSLESFWIPHDETPAKLIIKSRKTFMPLMVIYIQDTNPERIRDVLLKYIAETEHSEPLLKHLLEILGF